MSDTPSREEIHEAVDRAVRELLDDVGLFDPPVDVARIVQHLGLQPDAVAKRGRAGVVAKVEESARSRAWLEAHAIGQHLRPAVLRRLDLEPDQPLGGESIPNLFADRLLVPTRWLSTLGRELGWDLLELEPKFRPAGHEAVAWRMLDLAEPIAISIVDDGRVTRRRSNAFRVGKVLSDPEERCRQTVNRYSRPHVLHEGGWRVQVWPIYEMDGKREILRSQYQEE